MDGNKPAIMQILELISFYIYSVLPLKQSREENKKHEG